MLLRAIAGLMTPTTGTATVGNTRVGNGVYAPHLIVIGYFSFNSFCQFIGSYFSNFCRLTIVSLESKKDEKTGRFMMVPVEGS